MTTRILACLIFYLTAMQTYAQQKGTRIEDFSVVLDKTIQGISNTEFNGCTLLENKKTLVVVGHDKSSNQGVAYLIDAHSGSLVSEEPTFTKKDCRFNQVVLADDGNLIIGGILSEGKQQKGILLKVILKLGKEKWSHIDDEILFTHLVWLNNGTGIAAGINKNNTESVATCSFNSKEVFSHPQKILGAGCVKNITALLPASGSPSDAWIAGSNKKCSDCNKGNLWLYKLHVSQKGMITAGKMACLGDKDYIEEATSAAIDTFTGQLIFTGKAFINSATPEKFHIQPSVIEPENNNNSDNYAPLTDENDFVAAVTPTEIHGFLYLIAYENRGEYEYKLTYSIKDYKGSLPLTQSRYSIAPFAFFWDDAYNTILAVSNTGENNLRIAAIREKVDMNESDKDKLRRQTVSNGKKSAEEEDIQPDYNIQCASLAYKKNGKTDNTLQLLASEQGSIVFTLSNMGDLINERILVKTSLSKNLGVVVTNDEKIINGIRQNGKTVVEIYLEANDKITPGKTDVQIEVYIGDSKVPACNMTAKISVIAPLAQNSLFRIKEPDEEVKRHPDVEGSKKGIIVKVNAPIQVVSPEKIKFYPLKKDQKSDAYTVSDSTEEGYILNYTVDLQDGPNEFYLEYTNPSTGEQIQSSKIIINKRKEAPNVYILAIGVPSESIPGMKKLDYPPQDALSFFNAVKEQCEQGRLGYLKDAVLLNKPENTDKRSIEEAFEKMLEWKVGPLDHVYIFISSHGRTRTEIKAPFIVPVSYIRGSLTSCVDYEQMLERFVYTKTCRRFVFVDACHSGENDAKSKGGLEIDWKKDIPPDVIEFLSCRGDEFSYESDQYKHGIFTQAILDAIYNSNGLDYYDVATLQTYLIQRVATICKEESSLRNNELIIQTPVFRYKDQSKVTKVFGTLH